MAKRRRPIAGLDPVRTFPYYKIQVWNERVNAWRDVQKKFESLDELHTFARVKLSPSETTPVTVVEGCGSRRVDETVDAFGVERQQKHREGRISDAP